MNTFLARASIPLSILFSNAAFAEDLKIPIDDLQSLKTFLQTRQYQNFPVSEPEVHPSKNVHGTRIRTFLNKEMADGLGNRLAELPKNATAVKEVYTPEGVLDGWAVSIKLDDQSDYGTNWYWIEVVDLAKGGPGRVTSNERGSGPEGRLCVSCHQSGYDYTLTSLPRAIASPSARTNSK